MGMERTWYRQINTVACLLANLWRQIAPLTTIFSRRNTVCFRPIIEPANFYPVIEKAMAIGRRRAAYPHWGDRGEGHSGPKGMILSQWHGSLGTKPPIGNFSGVELPSHVWRMAGITWAI